MLVIVHDRDTDLLQRLFDFKTFRCGDILEVDPAKHRCDIPDVICKTSMILLKTYWERVNVGKFLEKNCFSLHNGDRCIPPYISKAEDD